MSEELDIEVRPPMGWGGLRAKVWNRFLDAGVTIHEADALVGLLSKLLLETESLLAGATPEGWQRLSSMAKRGAYDLHRLNYNSDRGVHFGPNAGWGAFEACQHPDCVLVRSLPAPPAPAQQEEK